MVSHYILGKVFSIWWGKPGVRLHSCPSAECRIMIVYHLAQFRGKEITVTRGNGRRETSLYIVIEDQAVSFWRRGCWEMTKCGVWLNIVRSFAVFWILSHAFSSGTLLSLAPSITNYCCLVVRIMITWLCLLFRFMMNAWNSAWHIAGVSTINGILWILVPSRIWVISEFRVTA